MGVRVSFCYDHVIKVGVNVRVLKFGDRGIWSDVG